VSERGSGILANAAYRTVADLVSKLGSLFLFVVMARKLGASEFGVFTFGLAFVTLVTAPADFGQNATLIREVARDRSRVHEYFTNTLVLKLALTLPTLAVALIVGRLVGFGEKTTIVALLLGLGVTIDQLNSTCAAVFQAYERLVYLPIALISQRMFTAVVGVAALAAGADTVAVAGIYLAGSLLGIAIAFWYLLRRIVRPHLTVDSALWWPLMRAAAPIGAAGIFEAVISRVDTAMLAAYKPDSVVGNYGAAYRLYETTFFLSWSVGAAVYPVLSRLALEDVKALARVFERSLKLLVAVTLPLAAGSILLGPDVIKLLYGDEFEHAGAALQLLGPAIALFPIAYVTAYLLVAGDRQRAMSAIIGVVAVENVVGNFILIPWLSLKGAALGNSISQALATVLMLTVALPLVGRVRWSRSLSGPAGATVIAAIVMLFLRGSTGPAIAAAAAAYVVALLAIEQLRFPDDAHVLWTLFRARTARRPAARVS
jgi:O-antigen/teichoic acid export membrane protein